MVAGPDFAPYQLLVRVAGFSLVELAVDSGLGCGVDFAPKQVIHRTARSVAARDLHRPRMLLELRPTRASGLLVADSDPDCDVAHAGYLSLRVRVLPYAGHPQREGIFVV